MVSTELHIISLVVVGYVGALYLIWTVGKIITTAFQSDLRRIPGPFLSKFTDLPLRVAELGGKRSVYIQSLHERYGPCVRIAPREIATADIEAWRKIHRIGSDYNKGPWYQGQSPFQYSDETCGVFGIRNNKTASHRRRMFQAAGTKKVVAEWEPQVVELAQGAVAKIQNDLLTQGKSDVMKWWVFMTSDVLGSLAFGESFNGVESGQKNQFMQDLEEAMQHVGIRMSLPWLGKLLEVIPDALLGSLAPPWVRFTSYGTRAVENTRAAMKGGRQTFFSKMVDEDGKQQMVPERVIEQEAANLMIAGTDTTSMTLTYLTYEVLKNPAVKEKLITSLKDCSASPDWTELEGVEYLSHVITEVMRTHPAVPASLTRVVPDGGGDVGAYTLPGGTIISTQAWTFHHDPNVFPDPYKFDPDRWISPTPEMKEYLMPFGGPVRSCPGQNIARLELYHGVYRLFHDLPDIKLASSATDESMEMVDYFTIMPKAGRCEVVMT